MSRCSSQVALPALGEHKLKKKQKQCGVQLSLCSSKSGESFRRETDRERERERFLSIGVLHIKK